MLLIAFTCETVTGWCGQFPGHRRGRAVEMHIARRSNPAGTQERSRQDLFLWASALPIDLHVFSSPTEEAARRTVGSLALMVSTAPE